MTDCYHFTKIEYLDDIVKHGLIPSIGNNSIILNDIYLDKVSYSIGIDGAIEMFLGLYEIYFNIINSNDDRSNYFLSRRRLFYEIMSSSNFKSWQKEGVYLRFDGDLLNKKFDEEKYDCYTTEVIPSKILSVCILKNRLDNSIISFSMYDIINYWLSRTDNYNNSFYYNEFKEDINKYKKIDCYVDYIDLSEFYNRNFN